MSATVRKIRSPLIWLGVALIYVLPFMALEGLGGAFMKFDGITGESRDEIHKEEIEVLSWSWGVRNPSSIEQGAHRTSGKPDFSGFTFTHQYDRSSPALALKCFKGERIDEAVFSVTRNVGDNTPTDYLIITFTDVLVTALSQSGEGSQGERPVEEVAITFGKLNFKYTEYDDNGKSKGAVEANWDLTTSKE